MAHTAGIFKDPDLNVKTIMQSWTTQAGYPLLTASRMNGSIHITQVSQMPNTAAFTKDTYD